MPGPGGVPERSKGTRCKRVGSAFAGSNPAPATAAQSVRVADKYLGGGRPHRDLRVVSLRACSQAPSGSLNFGGVGLAALRSSWCAAFSARAWRTRACGSTRSSTPLKRQAASSAGRLWRRGSQTCCSRLGRLRRWRWPCTCWLLSPSHLRAPSQTDLSGRAVAFHPAAGALHAGTTPSPSGGAS